MTNSNSGIPKVTIGLDLGDRFSHLHVLAHDGEVLEEGRIRTTAKALQERFERAEPCRIALETGTHSPWISRLLNQCASVINCCYAAISSTRSWSPRTTLNTVEHDECIREQKTSRSARRLFVSPACIAGVRISAPNFSARCGRTICSDSGEAPRDLPVDCCSGCEKELAARDTTSLDESSGRVVRRTTCSAS